MDQHDRDWRYYLEEGRAYMKHGEYEAALEPLARANELHAEKVCPEACYAIGNSESMLGRYASAIASYTKAENGSPGGMYPQASYNKGVAHSLQGNYRQAIEAFTKAESDSPDGMYPDASFNKGVAHSELCEWEQAIAAYIKAENDSPESKYPDVSHNKGVAHMALNQLELALAALTKAEKDSPGGAFPPASFGKGVLHDEIGEWHESIVAYTKAENDSPEGKYPNASSNKGLVHAKLGQWQRALSALTKAENDSPDRKHPFASHNKGEAHAELGQWQVAVACYQKAITDSPDEHFPHAHLGLSRAFRSIQCTVKARKHAYVAMHQDPRSIMIVDELLQHYSVADTRPFYQARFAYLGVQLDEADQAHEQFKLKAELRNKLEETKDAEQHDLKLFRTLLLTTNVEWPESIPYKDRVQLAYLTSYLNGKPWYTFHIIDTQLDGSFELDAMDHFFWLLSAYAIAEPVEEMLAIAEQGTSDMASAFGKKHHALHTAVAKAVEDGSHLDPYLLRIDKTACDLKGMELGAPALHPWVLTALKALVHGTPYMLPVSSAQLQGLLALCYQDIEERLDQNGHVQKTEWKNLSNALVTTELDFPHLIDLVRHAIQQGIPYLLVLNKVSEVYAQTRDKALRRQLAVVLAAVVISHNMDAQQKPFYAQQATQWSVNTLLEYPVGQTVGAVLVSGVLGHFLTAALVSTGARIAWNKVHERGIKIPAEKVFEQLKQELGVDTRDEGNDSVR